ncbi:MAG: 3-methyl-2-oxobutanoate hydroxymethyltransferase [Gemmatimonadota bacterium]|nr:3-methyl-2-oxobutanoate hydroxymethyltransferase [Gemmatimonadota bacterium]
MSWSGRAAALQAIKTARRKIVMVTAYDYVSARVAAEAGVDIVLVGDSAANTVLGYSSTRDVSLDEMIVLTAAVRRGLDAAAGAATPLLIGDMPYGTYEPADDAAVETARRFEAAGCDAVKLEGAGASLARVRAIVAAGIPVMGHVGLLPQRVAAGALRARGRTADEALAIARDARELEAAGCFAIVFEAMPAAVSALVVPTLRIPVIGIGAGAATDGQVLVFHDLVGLTDGRTPRFVKRYAELFDEMVRAVRAFGGDVREGRYPGEEHVYGIDEAELARLRQGLTT